MSMSRTTALLILTLLLAMSAFAEPPATPLADTNWLSYNFNVNGQRFIDLKQINVDNAAQLGEVCRLKVEDSGAFHTSLLEVDGVLFFTTVTDTLAVDATNCKVKWRHHYVTEDPAGTALPVNRGVAYANGKL